MEVGGSASFLQDAAMWNAALMGAAKNSQRQVKDVGIMQDEARLNGLQAIQAHPLAELLACPPATASLLAAAAQTIDFDTGQIIFRQFESCAGLYLVIEGQLVRRTERIETRVTLGIARAGHLVELAAALGDGLHTYSLVAQTAGSLLMLPIEALRRAFETHPPLRMRLLEELAREVSRAYHVCSVPRFVRTRRSYARTATA